MKALDHAWMAGEWLGAFVAVGLVLLLRLLLPRGARRVLRQPVLFLGLHVALRVVLTVVPEDTSASRVLSFGALAFILAAIGRSGVVLVLDIVLGRRLARPLPQIVSDITLGVVYTAVLLTALRAAGVEPGSILTTSALLTAAVALSLQETLGNMVAGLAIQVQRPFDLGDWIQFDPEVKHIGKVLEINWRATKVLTLDEVEVIVPNATLAKAAITNYSKPTPTSRRSLYVQVPAHVPPRDVQRIILGALSGSFGVVAEPAPSVVTNAFVDGNVEYWIRFFTDRFDKRDGVDGGARDRIWYALSRHGLSIASPGRDVAMHEVSRESLAREETSRVDEREALLRLVDFLRPLLDDQRRTLAAKSGLRLYADGETIVHQGDDSTEMFVVDKGHVVVVRDRTAANGERSEVELARLGPGSFFGEMALMTGERRTATVRAETACSMFVIDHAALRGVLESSPHLAEHISRVIAERQASSVEESARPTEQARSADERSSLLLGRIRKFFSL
jgi:small-conductance mechanosensitive channel/CRP-like cAMP-binding protein